MIATAWAVVLKLVTFTLRLLKKRAIASEVANFTNSAGCIAKEPISNHDFEPATTFPKSNTKSKLSREMP